MSHLRLLPTSGVSSDRLTYEQVSSGLADGSRVHEDALERKNHESECGWRTDPLNSAISQVVQLLLDDADVEKADEQRLGYLRAMCDAAAYNMTPCKISELLKSNRETEGSFFDPSKDMLTATAAVGNMHKLQILLSQGADPNIRSEYFGFALQNAAGIGREDMVLLLLQYNAKARGSASQGEAAAKALEAACEGGHERVVQCVLTSQHKVHSLETHYEAAVVAAAGNGHVDLVRLLLEAGTFPNKENMMTQSLFTGSAPGYPHVVQMLLESGLDVHSYNHEGKNSLHQAALCGHARVVRLLLDHGVNYYPGPWGDPLYLAAKNGHEDVVQMLLEYGANIDAEGPDYCVLARAARNGESRMIRFFLENGVDLKASHCGDMALELTADRGHEEIVRLLVGLGVDVNGREDRDSPMLRAMIYGHDHIVKTLLELGAKEVDPLKSEHAVFFLEGEYPVRGRP